MYCENCGTKLKKDSKICYNCGKEKIRLITISMKKVFQKNISPFLYWAILPMI